MLMQGKRPRRYADDYLKANTKESQKAALNGCPEQWRGLVKKHIWIGKVRL